MIPELLIRRAAIVRTIRRFFDDGGFCEIETPVRLEAPAPECHIDCPPVATGGFLRASPELQMKKLLANGFERIYQIGPCFRDGEKGSRHNPEFTMIEWYRRGATYREILEDTKRLVGACRPCALAEVPDRFREITVREAYRMWAGWDPWTAWDAERFDVEMATVIEPKLKALGGAVFLLDYPVAAASLARVSGDVAERWEFYWDGLELANCFTELCDEDEQRRRFAASKAERRELGEADYPLDEAFFGCLPRIGSAAGVALGVDRFAMRLLGVDDIAAVRVAP